MKLRRMESRSSAVHCGDTATISINSSNVARGSLLSRQAATHQDTTASNSRALIDRTTFKPTGEFPATSRRRRRSADADRRPSAGVFDSSDFIDRSRRIPRPRCALAGTDRELSGVASCRRQVSTGEKCEPIRPSPAATGNRVANNTHAAASPVPRLHQYRGFAARSPKESGKSPSSRLGDVEMGNHKESGRYRTRTCDP